jgi:hypothetical protein
MWHTTVTFNTLYISLSLFIISVFFICTERHRHWPVDWHADTSQFTCSDWNRRNLLVALNLMSQASSSIYMQNSNSTFFLINAYDYRQHKTSPSFTYSVLTEKHNLHTWHSTSRPLAFLSSWQTTSRDMQYHGFMYHAHFGKNYRAPLGFSFHRDAVAL